MACEGLSGEPRPRLIVNAGETEMLRNEVGMLHAKSLKGVPLPLLVGTSAGKTMEACVSGRDFPDVGKNEGKIEMQVFVFQCIANQLAAFTLIDGSSTADEAGQLEVVKAFCEDAIYCSLQGFGKFSVRFK